MGPYNFPPFTQFMTYFPLLLIILLILNYNNIWQKILLKTGVSKFGYDDYENPKKIERGRKLLKRGLSLSISIHVLARRIREKKFLSVSDPNLYSKHGYSVQMNLIDSQSEVISES